MSNEEKKKSKMLTPESTGENAPSTPKTEEEKDDAFLRGTDAPKEKNSSDSEEKKTDCTENKEQNGLEEGKTEKSKPESQEIVQDETKPEEGSDNEKNSSQGEDSDQGVETNQKEEPEQGEKPEQKEEQKEEQNQEKEPKSEENSPAEKQSDSSGKEIAQENEQDSMDDGEKGFLKKRRRRYQEKRMKIAEREPMGKKLWIVLGSVVGVIALVYCGIAAYFSGHFYLNTTINGKDFSGKNVATVEAYFQSVISEYSLSILGQNQERESIEGKEIDLVYQDGAQIRDALKSQNPFLWPKAFFTKSIEELNVDVDYNEEKLGQKISSLNVVTQEQTDPVSAMPRYNGTMFVVEPERLGTKVDLEVLTEKIKEAISYSKDELDLVSQDCYVHPKYNTQSPEVQAACDKMNEYCRASITYKMDQDIVVNHKVISTWLTCDDNMNVVFDEKKVKEWLKEFAKKYDTVGKKRSITSPEGKTVNVSGGTYGWSIDEKSELSSLTDSIKKGEVISREPKYEKKAASKSGQDWGNTYVEVDIQAQHMWYIVDGAVAMEADVVTGVPNPARETPTGVYSILEMKKNKTLVGAINPSTGRPSYRTPVAYWMRVTWTGIGFHDATWQSKFGGNRYKTGYGSHGCINMSLSEAGNLYGMLSVGTPVIIHN